VHAAARTPPIKTAPILRMAPLLTQADPAC
jgi:hypothetical protein